MITNFITTTLGDSWKKVYNIFGDYPEVVAKFLVNIILRNKNNNEKIEWFTNVKAT